MVCDEIAERLPKSACGNVEVEDIMVDHAGSGGSLHLLASAWDERLAGTLSPQDLLVYRSNLLGADKRITNFGGGNTSSKLTMPDPLTGAPVEVLWVKGSGGDLGSIRLDGFATLDMARFRSIRAAYAGPAMEDDVVALYPHCTFGLNPRAASIDTPLHGLIGHPHVDHVHPDAIIAIAASGDGEAMTRDIFGDDIGWLPWRRPGFELGLMLEGFVRDNPGARGVILGSHGLFTWGATQRDCYETTIEVINRAIVWLAAQEAGKPAFGGPALAVRPAEDRRATAARLMPVLRGLVSEGRSKVGHFDDQAAVLDFVCSRDLAALAPLGTSCPDHFLRTKIRPLVLDSQTIAQDGEELAGRLREVIAAYRADYLGYYERCRRPDSPPVRDTNPVVILVPGIGMLTFAADKATARIAAEFYVNAINVMRGAEAASTYVALPEQEAFDIEYWLLEEAKLQRLPKSKPLEGRVALVTGGAGGIGLATARRLLGEGACVVICDIDKTALGKAEAALVGSHGRDRVAAFPVDVTDERSVISLFREAALAFGGLDILVSNAGIASAAPLEETSLELWQRNIDILATGYFLVSREAFRLMKVQSRGGAIVFIASKNALVASPNASAYCTAKAAEVQLCRCLALEGAPHGIRANVVNPDAVLRGSRIWEGEWRAQRAGAYNVAPDDLDEVYRQRSMLKLNVFPEDIAEAVYFFASDLSAKSTGNILNVDAGHAPAFTR
jgi:rhamnulose-1-phosphate aldolase/alcohol dehydrogenase